MTRIVFLLSAMLITTAGSATTLEYHDLARISQSAEARAIKARFDQALIDQRADAIVATLNELALAAHDVTGEHLLVEGALRLAQMTSSPAATAALETLATRPVTVWVQHDHAGRRTPVTAFDVAAAARFALTQQQSERDATQLAQSLTNGTPVAPKSSASAAAAMAKLDAAQLRQTMPTLTQAFASDRALGAAIVKAAIPLQDADALVAVIERGNAPDAHAALRARVNFSGARHTRILDAALARTATRSAALYQLADDVSHDPALTPQLLAWLDDPSGAMAAAGAIASLDRSDLAAQIGEQLATETRPARAAALALALTLMHNDEALARIDAYVASPSGLPALKTKLAARRAQVAP